jgi:hypothetical protein
MPDLDETYEKVYERNLCERFDRACAERALKWLLCSCRTLTIEELAEAVAVDKDKIYPTVNADYVLWIYPLFFW